jgi:hypothetical protein
MAQKECNHDAIDKHSLNALVGMYCQPSGEPSNPTISPKIACLQRSGRNVCSEQKNENIVNKRKGTISTIPFVDKSTRSKKPINDKPATDILPIERQ